MSSVLDEIVLDIVNPTVSVSETAIIHKNDVSQTLLFSFPSNNLTSSGNFTQTNNIRTRHYGFRCCPTNQNQDDTNDEDETCSLNSNSCGNCYSRNRDRNYPKGKFVQNKRVGKNIYYRYYRTQKQTTKKTETISYEQFKETYKPSIVGRNSFIEIDGIGWNFMIDSIYIDKTDDNETITIAATIQELSFGNFTINEEALTNVSTLQITVNHLKKSKKSISLVSNDIYENYTSFVLIQNNLASKLFFTKYLDTLNFKENSLIKFLETSQDMLNILDLLKNRSDLEIFTTAFFLDNDTLAPQIESRLNELAENNNLSTFFASTVTVPSARSTLPLLGKMSELLDKVVSRVEKIIETNNKPIKIYLPEKNMFFAYIRDKLIDYFSEQTIYSKEYRDFRSQGKLSDELLKLVFAESASDVAFSDNNIDFLLALDVDVEGSVADEVLGGLVVVSAKLKEDIHNLDINVSGNDSVSSATTFDKSNFTENQLIRFQEVESTFIEYSSSSASAANAIKTLVDHIGENITGKNSNRKQYVGIATIIDNDVEEFEVFLSIVGRLISVTLVDINLIARNLLTIENLCKLGRAIANIFNITILNKVFKFIQGLIPHILSPINKIIEIIQKIKGQVSTVKSIFNTFQNYIMDCVDLGNELVYYLSYLGSYLTKLDSSFQTQNINPSDVNLKQVILKQGSQYQGPITLQHFLSSIEFGSNTFSTILGNSIRTLNIFQEIIHQAVSIVSPTENFIESVINTLGNSRLQSILRILSPISDVIEYCLHIGFCWISFSICVTDLIDALLYASDIPFISIFKKLLGDLIEEVVPMGQLKKRLQNLFMGAFKGFMNQLSIFNVYSIKLGSIFEHIFSTINKLPFSLNSLAAYSFTRNRKKDLAIRNSILSVFTRVPQNANKVVKNLLSLFPLLIYDNVPLEVNSLVKQKVELTSNTVISKVEDLMFSFIKQIILDEAQENIQEPILLSNIGLMETIISYLSYTYNIEYPFYNQTFLVNTFNLLGGDSNEPYWIKSSSVESLNEEEKNYYITLPNDIKMLNIETYNTRSICPIMESFTVKGNINIVSNYKFGNLTSKSYALRNSHHFSKLTMNSLVDIYLYFNTLQLISQHRYMLNIQYNKLTQTYQAILQKEAEISDIVALIKAVEQSQEQSSPPASSANGNLIYVNPETATGEDENIIHLVMFDIPSELTNPPNQLLLNNLILGPSISNYRVSNYSSINLSDKIKPNIDFITGWRICHNNNKIITTSFPTISIAWSNFWKNITVHFQNSFHTRARVYGVSGNYDGFKVSHIEEQNELFSALQIPYTTLYRILYETKQTNPSPIPCSVKYQIDDNTVDTIDFSFQYTGKQNDFLAVSEIFINKSNDAQSFNLENIDYLEQVSINQIGDINNIKTRKLKANVDLTVPVYDANSNEITSKSLLDSQYISNGTEIRISDSIKTLDHIRLDIDYNMKINNTIYKIFHKKCIKLSSLNLSHFNKIVTKTIENTDNINQEISKIIAAYDESIYNVLEITQISNKLISKFLYLSEQATLDTLHLKTSVKSISTKTTSIVNILNENMKIKNTSNFHHDNIDDSIGISFSDNATLLKPNQVNSIQVLCIKLGDSNDHNVDYNYNKTTEFDSITDTSDIDNIIIESNIFEEISSYTSSSHFLETNQKLDSIIESEKAAYAVYQTLHKQGDFNQVLSSFSSTNSIEEIKNDFYDFLELVISDSKISKDIQSIANQDIRDYLLNIITERKFKEAPFTEHIKIYLDRISYIAYHVFIDKSTNVRDNYIVLYQACFILDTLLKNKSYQDEFKASFSDNSKSNKIIIYLSNIISRYSQFDRFGYIKSIPDVESIVAISINVFKYLLDGVAESQYSIETDLTVLQKSSWTELQVADYSNLREVSLVRVDENKVLFRKKGNFVESKLHTSKQEAEIIALENYTPKIGDYIDVLMDHNLATIYGVKIISIDTKHNILIESILPTTVSVIIREEESVHHQVLENLLDCSKTIHSNYQTLIQQFIGKNISMDTKWADTKLNATSNTLFDNTAGFFNIVVNFINQKLKNALATFKFDHNYTRNIADSLALTKYIDELSSSQYLSLFVTYTEKLLTDDDSPVQIILKCIETLETNLDKQFSDKILHRLSVQEKQLILESENKITGIIEKFIRLQTDLSESKIRQLISKLLLNKDTDCQEKYLNETLLIRILNHITKWVQPIKSNLNNIIDIINNLSNNLSSSRIVRLKKRANEYIINLKSELDILQNNLENTHYMFMYICFLKDFNETSTSSSWSCFNLLFNQLMILHHKLEEAEIINKQNKSLAVIKNQSEVNNIHCRPQLNVQASGFECFTQACLLFDSMYNDYIQSKEPSLGAISHNLLVSIIHSFETFIQYDYIPAENDTTQENTPGELISNELNSDPYVNPPNINELSGVDILEEFVSILQESSTDLLKVRFTTFIDYLKNIANNHIYLYRIDNKADSTKQFVYHSIDKNTRICDRIENYRYFFKNIMRLIYSQHDIEEKTNNINIYQNISNLLDYTSDSFFSDTTGLDVPPSTTIFHRLKITLNQHLSDCTIDNTNAFIDIEQETFGNNPIESDKIKLLVEMTYSYLEHQNYLLVIENYQNKNIVSTNTNNLIDSKLVDGIYIDEDVITHNDLASTLIFNENMTATMSGNWIGHPVHGVVSVKHVSKKNLWIFTIVDNLHSENTYIKMVGIYFNSVRSSGIIELDDTKDRIACYKLLTDIEKSSITNLVKDRRFISDAFDSPDRIVPYSDGHYLINSLVVEYKLSEAQKQSNKLILPMEKYEILENESSLFATFNSSNKKLDLSKSSDKISKLRELGADIYKFPLMNTKKGSSEMNLNIDLAEYIYNLDLSSHKDDFLPYAIQNILIDKCIKNATLSNYSSTSFSKMHKYFKTASVEIGHNVEYTENIFGISYLSTGISTNTYEATVYWKADSNQPVVFIETTTPYFENKPIRETITTNINNVATFLQNNKRYYRLKVLMKFNSEFEVEIIGYEVKGRDALDSNIEETDITLFEEKIETRSAFKSVKVNNNTLTMVEDYVLHSDLDSILNGYELLDSFKSASVSSMASAGNRHFAIIDKFAQDAGSRISHRKTQFNSTDFDFITICLTNEINTKLNYSKITSTIPTIIKQSTLSTKQNLDLTSGTMDVTYIIIKDDSDELFSISIPEDSQDDTIDDLLQNNQSIKITNIRTGELISNVSSSYTIEETVNYQSFMYNYQLSDSHPISYSHLLHIPSVNVSYFIEKDNSLITKNTTAHYSLGLLVINKYDEVFVINEGDLSQFELNILNITDSSNQPTHVSFYIPTPDISVKSDYAIMYRIIYKEHSNKCIVCGIQAFGQTPYVMPVGKMDNPTETYSLYKSLHKNYTRFKEIQMGSNILQPQKTTYFTENDKNQIVIDSSSIPLSVISRFDNESFVTNMIFAYSKSFDNQGVIELVGFEIENKVDDILQYQVAKSSIIKADDHSEFNRHQATNSTSLSNFFELNTNNFTPTSMDIADYDLKIRHSAITEGTYAKTLYDFNWTTNIARSANSINVATSAANIFTTQIDYHLADVFKVDIHEIVQDTQDNTTNLDYNAYLLKSRQLKKTEKNVKSGLIQVDQAIRDLEILLSNSKITHTDQHTHNMDTSSQITLQNIIRTVKSDFNTLSNSLNNEVSKYLYYLNANVNTFESIDFTMSNINTKESSGIPIVIIRGYAFKDPTTALETDCLFDEQIVYNFMGNPGSCDDIIPPTDHPINPSVNWFNKIYEIESSETKDIVGKYQIDYSKADEVDKVAQYRFIHTVHQDYQLRSMSINSSASSFSDFKFYVSVATQLIADTGAGIFVEGAKTYTFKTWCVYDNNLNGYKGTASVVINLNTETREICLVPKFISNENKFQWFLEIKNNNLVEEHFQLNRVSSQDDGPEPGYHHNMNVFISTQVWELGFYDSANVWQKLYMNDTKVLTDNIGKSYPCPFNTIPVKDWTQLGTTEFHLTSPLSLTDKSTHKVIHCRAQPPNIQPVSQITEISQSEECSENISSTSVEKSYIKMISISEVVDFTNAVGEFSDNINTDLFQKTDRNDFLIIPMDTFMTSNLQPSKLATISDSLPSSCFMEQSLGVLRKISNENYDTFQDFIRVSKRTNDNSTTEFSITAEFMGQWVSTDNRQSPTRGFFANEYHPNNSTWGLFIFALFDVDLLKMVGKYFDISDDDLPFKEDDTHSRWSREFLYPNGLSGNDERFGDFIVKCWHSAKTIKTGKSPNRGGVVEQLTSGHTVPYATTASDDGYGVDNIVSSVVSRPFRCQYDSRFTLNDVQSSFQSHFEASMVNWFDKYVEGDGRNVFYHELQSYLAANIPEWFHFMSYDQETTSHKSFRQVKSTFKKKLSDYSPNSFFKPPHLNTNMLCNLDIKNINLIENVLGYTILKSDTTVNVQTQNGLAVFGSQDQKRESERYHNETQESRAIVSIATSFLNLAEIFPSFISEAFRMVGNHILNQIHFPSAPMFNRWGDMLYESSWVNFESKAISYDHISGDLNESSITIHENIGNYVDSLYQSILLGEDNYQYFIGFLNKYRKAIRKEIKVFQQLNIFQNLSDPSKSTVIQNILADYLQDNKNNKSIQEILTLFFTKSDQILVQYYLSTNIYNSFFGSLLGNSVSFTFNNETQSIQTFDEFNLSLAALLSIKAYHEADSIVNTVSASISDYLVSEKATEETYKKYLHDHPYPNQIAPPEGLGTKIDWFQPSVFESPTQNNRVYISHECIKADWKKSSIQNFNLDNLHSFKHTSEDKLFIIATVDDEPNQVKMIGLQLEMVNETIQETGARISKMASYNPNKKLTNENVTEYWNNGTTLSQNYTIINLQLNVTSIHPEDEISNSSELTKDLFSCFILAETVIFNLNNYVSTTYNQKLETHRQRLNSIAESQKIRTTANKSQSQYIDAIFDDLFDTGIMNDPILDIVIKLILTGKTDDVDLNSSKLVTNLLYTNHIVVLCNSSFAKKYTQLAEVTDIQLRSYIIIALGIINVKSSKQITNPLNLFHHLTNIKELKDLPVNFDAYENLIIGIIRYLNIKKIMRINNGYVNHVNSFKPYGVARNLSEVATNTDAEKEIVTVSNLIDASCVSNKNQTNYYYWITRIKESEKVVVQYVDKEILDTGASSSWLFEAKTHDSQTPDMNVSEFDQTKTYDFIDLDKTDYARTIRIILADIEKKRNPDPETMVRILPSFSLIADPKEAWGGCVNVKNKNKYVEIVMETTKLILLYNTTLNEQSFEQKIDQSVNSGETIDYTKLSQIFEMLNRSMGLDYRQLYTCWNAEQILKKIGFFEPTDYQTDAVDVDVELDSTIPSTQKPTSDTNYWSYKLFRYAIKQKFLLLIKQYIQLNIMKLHQTLSNEIINYISKKEDDDTIEQLVQS